MPTTSSYVGGFVLPLPPGAPNADLDDPTVLGLADFLRFTLREAINAKLATIEGASQDVLPVANVFPYDPASYFVRNAIPALYVWAAGKGTLRPWTLLYDVRVRQISVLYVYDEIVAPGGLHTRHGLIAAVDAALFRAAEHGYHPAYGFNGAPLGTPLHTSIGIKGFTYDGGDPGFHTAIPSASAKEGFGEGDGAIQRGYPSLRASFTVYEPIGHLGAPVGPDDENRELDFSIYGAETSGDGVLIQSGTITT